MAKTKRVQRNFRQTRSERSAGASYGNFKKSVVKAYKNVVNRLMK